MKPRYMITTAISYPNGVPHIGHAYELIAADVLARFKRLDGYDVFFLTGTDEHGQKIQQTAAKEGLSAAELVERNTPRFAAMAEAFLGSHDDFIRTTEERHRQSVQTIWKAMEARGDIYLSTYAGWYSTRDEAFYAEDETEVRADGVRYGPQGTPVAWMEENSYFFRLSKYQNDLLAHYEAHPEFIQPEARRNEVISFVKSGLKDLSISRTTFDWGIPVPDAPGHIMYVWVDALTNYITAAGYPNTSSPRWPYWPADVHIIGKDIIRFHAVYWPAFLMSAGLPLPKTVFGHGFLFNRGEKMSKSLGNVVDPFGMIETYGVDAVRYFFLREVPFGQDGSYSHEAIVNRTNADLANDLGNLAQRSLSMIAKNCGSQVPQPQAFSPDDKALLQQVSDLWEQLQEHMARYALHDALGSIMAVVSEANRYFAAQEPWALKKTDPERMNTVLYVTIEVLRQVGILLSPFLPQASTKLLAALGQEVDTVDKGHLTQALKPHSPLPAPQPLFPRYVEPETANNAG